MSYDKYERGHEHPNGGHQRITYKKKKFNTYPKAYPKQSLGRGRTCHSNSLAESPLTQMTSGVDKNKM